MNNILKQPFTEKEYADFAVYANDTQRRIENFNGDKYALLSTEILINGIITDISQTPEYLAAKAQKKYNDAIQYEINSYYEFLYRNDGSGVGAGACVRLISASALADETKINMIKQIIIDRKASMLTNCLAIQKEEV